MWLALTVYGPDEKRPTDSGFPRHEARDENWTLPVTLDSCEYCSIELTSLAWILRLILHSDDIPFIFFVFRGPSRELQIKMTNL
jgi:hypothetical protein